MQRAVKHGHGGEHPLVLGSRLQPASWISKQSTRSGPGTDLANERDAVAAITVLERFEIAAVTSISAWDPGGTRRRSHSGGIESQGGIC